MEGRADKYSAGYKNTLRMQSLARNQMLIMELAIILAMTDAYITNSFGKI